MLRIAVKIAHFAASNIQAIYTFHKSKCRANSDSAFFCERTLPNEIRSGLAKPCLLDGGDYHDTSLFLASTIAASSPLQSKNLTYMYLLKYGVLSRSATVSPA